MIWLETKNRSFSIKSLCACLELGSLTPFPKKLLFGTLRFQLRQVSLPGRLWWGKALTLYHIQRKGWSLVNRCFICHI